MTPTILESELIFPPKEVFLMTPRYFHEGLYQIFWTYGLRDIGVQSWLFCSDNPFSYIIASVFYSCLRLVLLSFHTPT
jgi:hypothetical protein